MEVAASDPPSPETGTPIVPMHDDDLLADVAKRVQESVGAESATSTVASLALVQRTFQSTMKSLNRPPSGKMPKCTPKLLMPIALNGM